MIFYTDFSCQDTNLTACLYLDTLNPQNRRWGLEQQNNWCTVWLAKSNFFSLSFQVSVYKYILVVRHSGLFWPDSLFVTLPGGTLNSNEWKVHYHHKKSTIHATRNAQEKKNKKNKKKIQLFITGPTRCTETYKIFTTTWMWYCQW